MKIGILSDLHVKLLKGQNVFTPFIEVAVEKFLDECRKRDVKRVVLLGDLFHVKNMVSTINLDFALEIIRKITRAYDTRMVVGNHDMYMNTENKTINLLKVFESDCRVYSRYGYEVLTEKDEHIHLHFLPYMDDDRVREALRTMGLNRKGKHILFTHLAVRGFSMDNGVAYGFDKENEEDHEGIKSSLEPADFSDDLMVYSGHFHGHQSRKNFCYVSSPVESRFGDDGRHGFVFFDTDSPREFEFVENDLSPRFVTIELNKERLSELMNCQGKFLRVVIHKNIDFNVLTKLKKKLESQNHYVAYKFDIADSIQKISVVDGWDSFIYEDTEKLIEKYVESVDSEFSPDELRSFIFF